VNYAFTLHVTRLDCQSDRIVAANTAHLRILSSITSNYAYKMIMYCMTI